MQPSIISGTISLLNSASGWITIIAPIVGGLFGGYHAIRKSHAEDDTEIKKHEKMIKKCSGWNCNSNDYYWNNNICN